MNLNNHIMMIRHAESAAQTGAESSDPALIPLNDNGPAAAKEMISQLLKPDRIIISPFIRTKQTAQSLIDLHPDVSVEEWPVQEFTYLDQSRCMGMTAEQRAPLVQAYWERNDPEFVDGDSAESFNQFAERVTAFLKRCESIEKRVYVFSHTMFMQAARMRMIAPMNSLAMSEFREACFLSPIRNLESLAVETTEMSSVVDKNTDHGLRQITGQIPHECPIGPRLAPERTRDHRLIILPNPKCLQDESSDASGE